MKNLLLMLYITLLLVGCRSVTRQYISKSSESRILQFNKIYYYDFYVRSSGSKNSLSNTVDSTLYYWGKIFFRNGIYRTIGFGPKQQSEEFINSSFISHAKYRDNWGVYELKNDSIFMFSWDSSAGYKEIELIGKFSENMMTVFKQRCSSCPKSNYAYQWTTKEMKYKIFPLTIYPDSTTEFIKSETYNNVSP